MAASNYTGPIFWSQEEADAYVNELNEEYERSGSCEHDSQICNFKYASVVGWRNRANVAYKWTLRADGWFKAKCQSHCPKGELGLGSCCVTFSPVLHEYQAECGP
ncbi:hypothetical protein JDV02_004414 [Purpureocillium takamizusanense]|uniref:Uncharacterized protein n=1 Tax=Purpureocillium takamizusanense TaxID=2060973 RepID=A0A9Q8VAR2_9HYPO|nr:uncharacterized protein JDV02_004414 [Purpureocillium takamizusanense]UNI18124.1 hypothetical protein JDV02_004414 [Purpureocillium takamizusanense]